jgi:hypothetical protein
MQIHLISQLLGDYVVCLLKDQYGEKPERGGGE